MSTTSDRAVQDEVRRDPRHARSPHHPVAAGRGDPQAVDPVAVGGDRRPEDRQVVRGEVDRRGPGPTQAETAGRRDERVEPTTHPAQVRPVDLAGGTGRFDRVAHPEQEAVLLEPPVEAAGQVEHHRQARRP